MPQPLLDFNIADATVVVWLYKKSTAADGGLRFTGRWVLTDDNLDSALRGALQAERAVIAEVNEYSLTSVTDEGIALRVDALVTHAGLITAQAADPVPGRKIKKLKQLQNTDFYVVKLVSAGQVLYAVRKTDNSWEAKKTRNMLSVLFADDQLGLNEAPGFNISRHVDFFIIGEDIVIINKRSFESVLNYKQAHVEDFDDLQNEATFSDLFTDVQPLVQFIGSNKLLLRRACAIRQKGHYRNPVFMARLRQNYLQCGLNLQFDNQGRIVPTLETCPDIVRALLDHRLWSLFSQNNYNVPDATAV